MSEVYQSNLLGMRPSAYRTCKDPELIKLLPKYKSNSVRILACDTEDNSKGKTNLINYFDGEHHFTFRNTSAAVEWLILFSRQYEKGVEVWFANFQYDMGNVFRDSQEFLSFVIAGSRFITGRVYQEKIKFKDILNVLPGASVKKIGKMINLEKIEVAGDFDNEEYCQRDTEIVFWGMLKFKRTLANINIEMKNTAAATGFNALLKKYKQLTTSSLTEEDHAFMKEGYYGGRTEVFNTARHTGDIFGYDIISSYPFAMCRIPIIDTSTKVYTSNPNFKDREGMCDCIIEAPSEITIPYLPVRLDGTLIFPRGVFRGVWSYYEINNAVKLGYKVQRVFQAIEFKNKFDFDLSGFINKFFKMRLKAKKDGDTVLDYACKIIMNASYGKLALGNEKTNLVAFEEFHKIKGDFSSEVFPNNQIIVKTIAQHAPSTNFLTAALITAYGRDRLYKYLIEGSENGRILLYCDTDSVFFRGDHLSGLAESPGLGDLELKDEISEAHFILPKTYYLRFKDGSEAYKCKGVRGELAREFFTKGFAESMQPLRYVETCRKNLYISERNKKNQIKEEFIPFNLWTKKPKRLKAEYNKRIKGKNGETRPIKLKYNIDTEENLK